MKLIRSSLYLLISMFVIGCNNSISQSDKNINDAPETETVIESNLDYKKYQVITTAELGDLSEKMWSKVIEKKQGIPQGAFKNSDNYFIYVQRIENGTRSFEKYTFNLNGGFLSKKSVDINEVKYLLEKAE